MLNPRDLPDINIRALSELTLRFLPAMVARGRGGILNVGYWKAEIAGFGPAAASKGTRRGRNLDSDCGFYALEEQR
jgi:short-subunit dehydrogenase